MSDTIWTAGQRVVVHTSLGWLKGVIYEVCPSGAVQVEIQKVWQGKRGRLPKEARTIWPWDGRYGVLVPCEQLNAQHIQSSPFSDTGG